MKNKIALTTFLIAQILAISANDDDTPCELHKDPNLTPPRAGTPFLPPLGNLRLDDQSPDSSVAQAQSTNTPFLSPLTQNPPSTPLISLVSIGRKKPTQKTIDERLLEINLSIKAMQESIEYLKFVTDNILKALNQNKTQTSGSESTEWKNPPNLI